MGNRELIEKIIADLNGTAQDFDTVFFRYVQTDRDPIEYFSFDELSYIDDRVLMCQGCGWWYDANEINDDCLCPDCAKDQENDEADVFTTKYLGRTLYPAQTMQQDLIYALDNFRHAQNGYEEGNIPFEDMVNSFEVLKDTHKIYLDAALQLWRRLMSMNSYAENRNMKLVIQTYHESVYIHSYKDNSDFASFVDIYNNDKYSLLPQDIVRCYFQDNEGNKSFRFKEGE